MKTYNLPVSILFLICLFIGVGLPTSVDAKGHAREKPVKITEATITAIADTTISVTYPKAAGPRNGKAIGDESDMGMTKTYKVDKFTDIEINGQTGQMSDLQVGMAVSVSADPDLTAGANDPTDGGTARTIIAHDAPPQ